MADRRARDDEAVGMDRVGGVGYHDRVARPHTRQRQVRQRLYGLAQPHVVGQAAADAEVRHLDQPSEAPALVGPQRADKAGRFFDVG